MHEPEHVPADAALKRAKSATLKATTAAATVERVNLGLPPSMRPLAGADVSAYIARHGLERVKAVEQLGLARMAALNDLCRDGEKALPMDIEILLRRLLEIPPTKRPTRPKEIFDVIYAPLIEAASPDRKEEVRIALYKRFAALFGRTIFASYRWLQIGTDGRYGEATAPLRRLMAIIPLDPQGMRDTLENLAREVFTARGRNFENEFPIPELK